MKQGEFILCAAIWFKDQGTATHNYTNIDRGLVICGARHVHCISVFTTLTEKRAVKPEAGEMVQGFITNEMRFVDRKEAFKIALKADQLDMMDSIPSLTSEYLY